MQDKHYPKIYFAIYNSLNEPKRLNSFSSITQYRIQSMAARGILKIEQGFVRQSEHLPVVFRQKLGS